MIKISDHAQKDQYIRLFTSQKGAMMFDRTILDQLQYPGEIAKDIATREKKKRRSLGLTQAELSSRAGMSLASLKRFEQTGEISFVSLLKIASVLDELDAFGQLFTRKGYRSIQEVIDERDRQS